MNRRLSSCLGLVLLATAACAHAQLYKWVDANGKVNYTDTPPPATAKSSERKTVTDSSAAGSGGMPYELSQAVQNAPVTFYSTANCAPCDEGRALLAARGIPFTEKTVTTAEDLALLKRAGSSGQLPFLLVGRNSQQGMEATLWNNLLSAAAYPEKSLLPKSYRNPPASAAAPTARAAAARTESPATADTPGTPNSSGTLPPAVGNVPPGFRF